MTTDIPDDVVETLWCDLCEKTDRTSPPEYPDMALITLDELRAAGRVFVEWERERIYTLIEQYLGQEDLLNYLRSRDLLAEKLSRRSKIL